MPVPNATGPPKTHSAREVLNVIFYIIRGGCAWRPSPLHQRGDEPPDGKAFGSLMRLFRRFHVGILGGCTRHCSPSYYPRCGTGGTDQSRHLGKEDRKGVDAQRASGSGTWLPTPWWCVSRAKLRELQLTTLQSVEKVTDLPLGGEGGYYFL